MSLKIRLSLLYGLSVFIILLVSAISVYILNEDFRKNEFDKRLMSEARVNGRLLYQLPQLSEQITSQLQQNATNALHEQVISIYDSAFRLVFSTQTTGSTRIPVLALIKAAQTNSYIFSEGKREGILLKKQVNQKRFYLLVSAIDFFGRRKSDNLKIILLSSVAVGILLSGLGAFLYVRQAMKPLEDLKGQIEKINETNLTQRIAISRNNTEVSQIAMKFNAMLDRLEQAFEQRKNFVHHASHELRTPLANMLSQTEAALNKELVEAEYKKVLLSLKEDQQDMIDLTNSLLTLSRYEKVIDTSDWTPVRIDEILYETADNVSQIWPAAEMVIDFSSVPENENFLVFLGNESLLKSALQNLIKNAIEYSEDLKVKINIEATEAGIILHFDNAGKQLTAAEQKSLFVPFFRGENAAQVKGYGLGLSIVDRIMRVHNARISYQLLPGGINRFAVFLPAKTGVI